MTIKKVIESQTGHGIVLGTRTINENFEDLEARIAALEPAVVAAAANAKGQATAATAAAQDKTPGNSEFGHSHGNHGHNK